MSKFAILISLMLVFTFANAFSTMNKFNSPSFIQGNPSNIRPSTNMILYAEPEDASNEEEEGLDLDLGEMFDMFDAADKGKSFDDTVKDIKGGK